MKDDLLLRLRQKVVETDNNGQSYLASMNIDGDEAADEIERLRELLRDLRDIVDAPELGRVDAALNKGGGHG